VSSLVAASDYLQVITESLAHTQDIRHDQSTEWVLNSLFAEANEEEMATDCDGRFLRSELLPCNPLWDSEAGSCEEEHMHKAAA
jgi:hypothetical protein